MISDVPGVDKVLVWLKEAFGVNFLDAKFVAWGTRPSVTTFLNAQPSHVFKLRVSHSLQDLIELKILKVLHFLQV